MCFRAPEDMRYRSPELPDSSSHAFLHCRACTLPCSRASPLPTALLRSQGPTLSSHCTLMFVGPDHLAIQSSCAAETLSFPHSRPFALPESIANSLPHFCTCVKMRPYEHDNPRHHISATPCSHISSFPPFRAPGLPALYNFISLQSNYGIYVYSAKVLH